MTSELPALFVSHHCALSDAPGGVQRCTREYRETLREAGFELHTIEFEEDRRFTVRLRRKLFPRPCGDGLPSNLAARCLQAAEENGARWIFLNHTSVLPLVPFMKAGPGNRAPRFVFLSHGADSTDYLIESRLRGTDRKRSSQRFLGRLLFAEAEQRKHLDAVLCLSAQDEAIERWLGSRRTLVVPRVCPANPLAPNPVHGRIGTVTTLSHGPNIDGLRQAARALRAYPSVVLRVVGGPAEIGHRLASEFAQIEYVGPLDDEALAKEAALWTCFLNPVFCQPKGVSTKLAVPLGWHLPIATTAAGARGYVWDPAVIPFTDTPEELAARAHQLAFLENPEAERAASAAISSRAPTTAAVGRKIREFLGSLAAE